MQGLRKMYESDVDQVRDLLNGFLFLNAKIHQFWSLEEVGHAFLKTPVHNYDIHTYVVEEYGKITDLFSFYITTTTVLKDCEHKQIN